MSNRRQWWTSTAGQAVGPNSEAYVTLALRSGLIASDALACEQGRSEWRKLCDWLEFAAACPPKPTVEDAKLPWSPVAILAWGCLFTPLWAGVLARMNSRRLGIEGPHWRPVAIGIAGFVAWIAVGEVSVWLNWVVSAAALGLLWFTDLRSQTAAWKRRPLAPSAGFWVPGLLGSPLGLLALYGIVFPLYPTQPSEVCALFARAKTSQEAQAYATQNLWPALTRMKSEVGTRDESLEVLAEEVASAELGGRLVACRFYWSTKNEPSLLEGIFHLVPLQGSWKIEEIYITAFNHSATATPVRLSQSYRNLETESGLTVETAPAGEPVEMQEVPAPVPVQPKVRPTQTPPTTFGSPTPADRKRQHEEEARNLRRWGGVFRLLFGAFGGHILIVAIAILMAMATWIGRLRGFTPQQTEQAVAGTADRIGRTLNQDVQFSWRGLTLRERVVKPDQTEASPESST